MSPGPAASGTARTGRSAGPALALAGLVALLSAVVGAVLTGEAAPSRLGDPGVVVRWGFPATRALHDVAAAVAIGGLLGAAALVSPDHPAWPRARALANVAAVVWTLAAVGVLVLGAADVAVLPLTDPGFGPALWQYVSQVSSGRQVAIEIGLVAVVAVLASAVRGPVGAAVAGVLAVVALVPLALTGHSGGTAGHELVVSSWWLHLVAVCGWSGGLVALAWLGRRGGLGRQVGQVARRYSVVAGWGFALVAGSGAANAWARVGGLDGLASRYGALLLAKAAVLVALAVAGWWHRRRLLDRLDRLDPEPSAFWRLVGAEVVLMALAIGAGVALSGTASPVPEAPPPAPTPAELLTGEPLPPALTLGRLLTQATPDALWVSVVAVMVLAYVLGVRRLSGRGDRWPVNRTIFWLLGCAALLYVTSGGVAVYGRVLFSVHMVQHMTLSMVVAPLLVLGAPVTLALRALTRRTDGSRGPREWLLAVVESRPGRVLSNPVVAAVVFAASMVVFYYSPLFGLALSTLVGHELMMVHFLLAGYLFANGLVGVDPGPQRPVYPLRLLILFATMGFHAFFGVAITSSETLLEATYFSSLGWGIDALADQKDGGAIAWGIGEVPTLLIALVVAYQWFRTDSREALRRDRAADRDGDADLAEYNAMLHRLRDR